jgi:hypothetical protein
MKTIYTIENGNYYCDGYSNDYYFLTMKDAIDFLHNKWNMKLNREQALYLNDKEQKWASIMSIHPYDPEIDL